jgi:hypothetical protein
VVLFEQLGQLEHPDRAAQVDGHQVLGQGRVEGDPGAVQQQRPEPGARGAPDDVKPDIVVVVVSHPFIMNANLVGLTSS